MTKRTEAQKKAQLKYRSGKTKQLRVQFTLNEYNKLAAYCHHIGSPIGTLIHNLVRREMESDATFVYNPELEHEDDYED